MRRHKRRILLIVLFAIAVLSVILVIAFYRHGHKTADPGEERAVVGTKTGKTEPDGPPLPDTVSIAFYNVENLFDFVLDGTEYDEFKPGWFGWTEEVQRRKVENAAQVVAAVGADVIGLCEVENMNALRELQNRLDRMDAPYPYAAVAEAEGSSTVTALLSKFPIRERHARAVPVERSRAILEALITRGGDSLRVFVNHWPSKRSPESARKSAAQTLADRVNELPPGTDYVILGDMNANYNEYATFHTLGFNDTEGQTGINHVLKTVVIDAARPLSPPRFVCKSELPAACDGCHYNLWLELDENVRRSYVFRGARQTLDHIIVPPALFDGAGYSYLDGTFEVFTWDGKLLKDGVPYRWQMVFRGKERYHTGRGYSDHLPIQAKFVRAAATGGESANRPAGVCDTVDGRLRVGDFAVTVDGWVSGDSRFTAERDARFARTGTHSLRVHGYHETENRTAARVKLQPLGSPKHLSLSIRGSGSLSIRLRRQSGKWVVYNAPGFTQSKSARYKPWKAASWTDLRLQVPEPSSKEDIELELRAGKGEQFSVWVDRVRLE